MKAPILELPPRALRLDRSSSFARKPITAWDEKGQPFQVMGWTVMRRFGPEEWDIVRYGCCGGARASRADAARTLWITRRRARRKAAELTRTPRVAEHG